MGMAHVTSGRTTFTYQDLIDSKVKIKIFQIIICFLLREIGNNNS